jgi:hypothetical protein
MRRLVEIRDFGEHRHRAAGVDHVRAGAIDRLV